MDVRDQHPAYVAAQDASAPEGAPNVVVVLLDDCGFGAASPFGGPVHTPAADRLAEGGLRFTRFHTTAICSSTRAALLTGRNHHSVGMGHVTNLVTPPPGYDGRMPASAATIARILTANGYATGAFGKMHETPLHEVSPTGPFDRWPTHRGGFQRFYGFLGGEVSHYCPPLYDGTTPVEPPKSADEGYHLSEDLVDQALTWIRDVRSLDADKPFFCYLPFGATHAPFHVHREWIDKYRGKFDHGWNRQREITLERQQELGIVPPDTELTPWASSIPLWTDLTHDEQRATAALMECYAGFLEHTDAQVGRLLDALEEMRCLDNTVVFYIVGDNGASAEGGILGTPNEYLPWNGIEVTADTILAEADRLGGPETWPNYGAGWALAMDTPYQWVKQVASHYGGTRNGLIVHWPDGIDERGGLRHQFSHVIDITPTILDIADIPAPTIVDGAEQQPIEGISMAYALNDPEAHDQHITQYFEIGGSRAIYHEGWVACTVHRPDPWRVYGDMPDLQDDVWELYDTTTDWSQARNVATEQPERLERLKELFLIQAARHQVLPIEDRPLAERRKAGLGKRVESMTFHGSARRIPGEVIPRVIGTSFSITADVMVPGAGAHGVICAQGGSFSGWSLYCVDGRLSYCMNVGAKDHHYVRAEELLVPGQREIRFDFDFDGGRLGAGGDGTLLVDGTVLAQARIPSTVGMFFQVSESFNVGVDPFTPVSPEYRQFDNAFTGTVRWVRIELGEGLPHTLDDHLRNEQATH
jgi:arylsulfatase